MQRSIRHLFAANVVVDFFLEAGLVEGSQAAVVRRGVEAWNQKDFLPASAILLPIVEDGFVACCSALGGEGLAMSRSESMSRRTGDAITAMVHQTLGEDWAFFFRHVWAREGAIRHAYCHGYLTDEQVSSRESDLSIFALIALAYYLFGKHAYDKWVREAAYFNWLNRGCPSNDDLRDWFAAELQLGQDVAEETGTATEKPAHE